MHRAKAFGRCEAATGIAPFERLVDQVMSQPPYDTARRIFWVTDNGSSHRGDASVQRLTHAHPRLVPVHGPVHASWLNQIEIYFSIVQRKVLTPNDFPCLQAVAQRLADFERYFESIARPFEWKLTRTDLNALIARMRDRWALLLQRKFSCNQPFVTDVGFATAGGAVRTPMAHAKTSHGRQTTCRSCSPRTGIATHLLEPRVVLCSAFPCQITRPGMIPAFHIDD
ncbi:transposase [Variovorax brevis]|uniref:transposase n=1 Tax=Variovorax brevis TaxID=3053503 RepID=UPI0033655CC8